MDKPQVTSDLKKISTIVNKSGSQYVEKYSIQFYFFLEFFPYFYLVEETVKLTQGFLLESSP